MTLRRPSLFFRAIVLGAQGVFYNLFCRCEAPLQWKQPDFRSSSPLLYHFSPHVSSLCWSPRRGGRFDIVSLFTIITFLIVLPTFI